MSTQSSFFTTPQHIPDPEKARAALKERLAQRSSAPVAAPTLEPRGQYLKVKIEDAPEFERRTGFVFAGLEEHPIHGLVFKGTFARREA